MIKYMQKFSNLLVIALCAILLSSCNPNGLEYVFFSKADSKDVEKNSYEVVLPEPAEKTVMKVEQKIKEPVVWKKGEEKPKPDTTLTITWVADGSIPAKTTVRVLAASYLSGNKGIYLNSQYVVELPDGSRCIASFEKITKPLLTPSGDSVRMSTFLRYDRTGRTKKMKSQVIDNLIGKSLAEAEKAIGPANQITVKEKGKVKEVMFSNTRAYNDSIIMFPLVLKVEDDIVTANISVPKKVRSPINSLDKFLMNCGKITGNNGTLWGDFYAWRHFSLIGKIGVPDYTTRAIISVVLFAILFFVFYLLFAPVWAVKSVAYIKPLGNGTVKFFSRIVFILMCLAGILIWSPLGVSVIGMIIVLIWGFWLISADITVHRCPHCNTYGKMRNLGEKNLGTREDVFDTKHSRYKGKDYEQYNKNSNKKEIITPYYKDATIRETWKTKRWSENYHCDACNRDVIYRHKETSKTTEMLTKY